MAYTHLHRVRESELDPAGVLWPAKLLGACHDAWEALLAEAGLPIARLLAEGRYGLPIAHVALDAPAPVRGPELQVSVRVLELGERSLRVGYAVSAGGGELARAETVHVVIDPRERRSIPVPAELAAALAGYRE